MENSKATVLVVDDEVFNIEILTEHLEEEGYHTVSAENGAQAWALLEEKAMQFDCVLLDRMMPEMDGMEVLSRIKKHPGMNNLPVIIQTAKAAKEDVLEGLKAGAYYYLTKPYERDHLLAVVRTAISDHQKYQSLKNELKQTAQTLSLMNKGQFSYRTLDECRKLASLLSNACPNPGKQVLGLSELMINAIEHGNLAIGYDEKSVLNEQDCWETEVERRLSLVENIDKCVIVEFERSEEEIRFLIQDQGNGFDWQKYQQISPERAFDNHGRGIAMANMTSFDKLEYHGNGSQVLARVFI